MSNVTYNYTYDDLYRLTEFKQDTTSIRSYQYDHNGNLTQKGSASFTYANDNNQLTSTGSVNYLYDLAGRVTKIGSDSLLYDCLDNMTAHANDEYGYDADNNRIFREQNGDSTWYFRHGMDVLSEYRTGTSHDGIDSVEYIYSVEGKLVQLDFGKGYHWYYKDHLGSTRDMGDAQFYRDYYPFGEDRVASTTDETAYQFTGKEKDSNSGFIYFGARYYDPSIGRFISVDPLAEKYPGWSPYVYALDNPLKFIDPDGRDVFILNDKGGARGFGHNAMLVGNDDTGWIYYSRDKDGGKYNGDTRKYHQSFDNFFDTLTKQIDIIEEFI